MAFWDFALGTGKVEVPGEALNYKTANPPAMGGLLLLLIAAEVSVLIMSTFTEDGYSKELAIGVGTVAAVALVLYFLSLLTRRERRCPVAPDLVHIVWIILFHLPGVFFDAVGYVDQTAHFWFGYTHVNHVMMLDLQGILCYMIGYNLFAKPPSAYTKREIPAVEQSALWLRFGQFVFLIGVLMHAYFSVTQISIWQMLTSRYTMERYHSAEFDERWWFTGMFFCRIGIILIAVASCVHYKKMMHGALNWAIFILYAAFIFVTGHRGVVVMIVMGPIFAYSFLVKPLTIRAGVIIAMAGLFAMTVGLAVRQLESKDIEGLQRAVSEQKEGRMFHAIIEAGNSAKAFFRAHSIWGIREGYEWGNTFFQGALRSIPNLGPTAGMLFPSENPAHKTIRLTAPEAHRKGIGYGFSIIAESYINFGLLGPPIVLTLAGFITRRLFDRAFYERNLYRMVICLAWCTGFVNWIRNESYSSFKPISWAILLMVFAKLLLNSSAKSAAAATGQAAPSSGSARSVPSPQGI